MPDEKTPILDPEHELPSGYDAQLETEHTEKLDAGYGAQLDPAQKKAATLPITHYQNLPTPGFFSRNKYLFFLLPIILLFVSGAIAILIVSDAQRKEQGPQPTKIITPTNVQPTSLLPAIQTYRNTLYGITFQYPSELHVSENSETISVSSYAPSETKLQADGYGFGMYFTKQDKQSLQAYATAEIAKMKANKVRIVTPLAATSVGLIKGYMVQVDGVGSFDYYFLLNDITHYFVQIEIGTTNLSRSNRMKITNILSTFSFLETTQGTFCGGIAAIQCQSGYSCQLDGSYPDAGGHCVADTKPIGGLSVKPTDGPTLASNQAVETAKGDLAHKIGKDVDTISLVSVSDKEWSDSSLGCPKPGIMYMQVITPGFLVMLSDGTKQYEYHTDKSTRVVDCTK